MKKFKSMPVRLAALAVGLLTVGWALAGSLDAPASPTNSASAMFTLNDIYNKLDMRSNVVVKRTGGFAEPTAGPTNESTPTLNDIMTLVTNRAPVAKTGQTTSYVPYDDGWYSTNVGVAWPTQRFTAIAVSGPETNQIKDNLTGLIWARNANIASGTVWSVNGTCTWAVAFNIITNMSADGPVNGANYGGTNDWRMPNVQELWSLMDIGNQSLPTGHPFVYVQGYYWSNSTRKDNTAHAWMLMKAASPQLLGSHKTNGYYGTMPWVWPVRGGGQ